MESPRFSRQLTLSTRSGAVVRMLANRKRLDSGMWSKQIEGETDGAGDSREVLVQGKECSAML
jgi:hypothetical protein